MELDLLRTFLAVAEARSFNQAARKLHTVESTVSRRISRLEAELGSPIFERYGRHVECTVFGEMILPLAQSIVTRTDEVISLAHDQSGIGLSRIRLGATGNVIALLLIPILSRFMASHPKVAVELAEKDDASLEQAVVSGELDFAVLTPWGTTRTANQYLLREEILLLVPANHEFASLPAVPLQLLAAERIVLPSASMNVSNIFSHNLRRAGVTAQLSYRATHPELSKALVRRGFGVAPMPTMLVPPEVLAGLKVVPFDPPMFRELHLVSALDRRLPAVARTLMSAIRAGLLNREIVGQGKEDGQPRGRKGTQPKPKT